MNDIIYVVVKEWAYESGTIELLTFNYDDAIKYINRNLHTLEHHDQWYSLTEYPVGTPTKNFNDNKRPLTFYNEND